LIAVIPDRAKRESGIHNHKTRGLNWPSEYWIG
jgi:hypothetical protein